MILNFIFVNYNKVEFGKMEVEEKQKTYKVIKVYEGKFYGSLISKDYMINKVKDDILIYTCSKEQAKEIWNKYKDDEIRRLENQILKIKNKKLK